MDHSVMDSSGYCFAALAGNLSTLRGEVLTLRKEKFACVNGTILLSTEGVNIRLSGPSAEIAAFKTELDALLKMTTSIQYKDTLVSGGSMSLPRFLVKVKKELISMGMERADPSKEPSPASHLSPVDFHEMLVRDDVLVLDTRNDYEIRMGKFKNAVHLPIETFRQFPSAVEEAAAASALPKDKKILMYCTGGIRCEKAAFAMTAAGFDSENLYQLEGGVSIVPCSNL